MRASSSGEPALARPHPTAGRSPMLRLRHAGRAAGHRPPHPRIAVRGRIRRRRARTAPLVQMGQSRHTLHRVPRGFSSRVAGPKPRSGPGVAAPLFPVVRALVAAACRLSHTPAASPFCDACSPRPLAGGPSWAAARREGRDRSIRLRSRSRDKPCHTRVRPSRQTPPPASPTEPAKAYDGQR